MFLTKEEITNLVNVVRDASNKFNNGCVSYKVEESDISVFKTITSMQAGCWLFFRGKRVCYIDQTALDRAGNEGIEYGIRQWLHTLAKKQALAKVTLSFIDGHPSVPFSKVVSGYTVEALPMKDSRFTQIKVTEGETIVAIYVASDDIECSQALEDVEDVLINRLTNQIMDGKVELNLE
jgi:hypothetical protein